MVDIMKYTIREFAELLGVTVDTLRLYEKHGIIKPTKDKRNSYRYFTDFDARNMLMSRWYRSLEFSMQEAASLTGSADPDSIIEKVKDRKKQLEEEIKKKTMLLQKMSEINLEYEEINHRLEKCSLKELPGVYRIKQTEKNSLRKDSSLTEIVEEWMKYLPFTFFSFHIDRQEVINKNNCFDYNWGLALFEEDARRLQLKPDEGVEYLPPANCVSSLIISSSDYITKDSIIFMLEYIKEKGYKINGDIFGKIVLTETSNTLRHTYIEVNIPVEN
jgi:DNA-binding transcriptional MerR regulator